MYRKYKLSDEREYFYSLERAEGRKSMNEWAVNTITGIKLGKGYSWDSHKEYHIFNSFTGKGGLSGHNFADYENFAQYTAAKQEFEVGQFFTHPYTIAEFLKDFEIRPVDLVFDGTCGMGNYFNFCPVEENCYGVELDETAAMVAQFLYPKANITQGDFLNARFAKHQFDVALCNPPFNLKWQVGKLPEKSQNIFLRRMAEWLKPAAMAVVIVPFHWLEDEFFYKSTREQIAENYSYVGGYKLPDDAFKLYGVAKYETKVLFLQRLGAGVKPQYYNGLTTKAEALKRLNNANGYRIARQSSIQRDIWQGQSKSNNAFQYKISKYLYEMQTHRHLTRFYPNAVQFIKRFQSQVKPESITYEKWAKTAITEKEVIGYFKRCFTLAEKGEKKEPQQLSPKRSRQKERVYQQFRTKFEDIEPQPEASVWIDAFSFIGGKGTECKFTPIQRDDLNRLIQKRYALLNWEMGAGKTAVSLAWAMWQLMSYKAVQVIVCSTKLSIESTWADHLTRNGIPYRIVNKRSDYRADVPVLLLTFDGMKRSRRVTAKTIIFKKTAKGRVKGEDGKPIVERTDSSVHTGVMKLYKHCARYIKSVSNKVACIIDESHELKNHTSVRYRMVFTAIRNCHFKLDATGTATLNDPSELYPQLQLLTNNSPSITNDCEFMYSQDKDGDITRYKNGAVGSRFTYRYGMNDFRECFNPSRATVLGLTKQNQDLYNPDYLKAIIDCTIITRTFNEISAEISDVQKYHFHHVSVPPCEIEADIYNRLYEAYQEIMREFYASTGNARKDASRRRMQQLDLLFKSANNPHLFSAFRNAGKTIGSKREEIVRRCLELTEPVLLGCLTLESVNCYKTELERHGKTVFVVTGELSTAERKDMSRLLQTTPNSVLVCTQQSLKSSINIPECNLVFAESIGWNLPTFMQFVFRTVRLDSDSVTHIYIFTMIDSIEENQIALVMDKQLLNEFIRQGKMLSKGDVFEGYDMNVVNRAVQVVKEKGADGKEHSVIRKRPVNWGASTVVQD